MIPRLEDGWLVVPCNAADLATVHVGVLAGNDKEPGLWYPAFRDWDSEGVRVAKIRPPLGVSGKVRVWLRVGDSVTKSRSAITL